MKKLVMFLISVFVFTSVVYSAKPFRAVVTKTRGKAFVKLNESEPWQKCYTAMVLDENATVKTNRWSKVEIILSDRSKINMKGDSQLKLNNLSDEDKEVEQQKGKTIFKVAKLWRGGKFRCKTPVAVCSVRGTEFAVEVGDDNKSTFKVFEGMVDVSGLDGVGGVTLNPNEKIDVMENIPMGAPTPFSMSDQNEKSDLVKTAIAQGVSIEVSADLSKEAIQKAAADEIKNAEYQNGKTIIDVYGKRVRIEDYIVRTAVNQYKLVVLNERDDRYDYLTNIQTFNKELPVDLSVATKSWREWSDNLSLNTQTNVLESGTQPEYYPIANESAASNTEDVVDWGFTGGHIVTNGNLTYTHFYDNYNFNINGNLKISFKPQTGISNISSIDERVYTVEGYGDMTNTEFFEGTGDWVGYYYLWSAPSGLDVVHTRGNITFGAETYQEDYYTIDDEGNTVSVSDYISNGVNAYNMQMIMSGSDFKGTGSKIDLCVEPQILIDAGILAQ
ncbi:MAG: FecR domain-containing protein [Endomicrobiales bacterium]|nr:FecR domain-containing protein [Endomicrobiales bacterium]